MDSGNIVEFIDRQKIMTAVVMETKNLRLRLLTENNREVNISAARLSHRCATRLDLSIGRTKIVDILRDISNRRKALISQINIQELWEVLNTEQEWIDLATMTAFCFPENPNGDHESAVLRAFFNDRRYFRFDTNSFFPFTEQQVEQALAKRRDEQRKARITEQGGQWLNDMLSDPDAAVQPPCQEIVDILQSYYLYDKESPHYAQGKAMAAKAGLDSPEHVFSALVRAGIWDPHENLDLVLLNIPTEFPPQVTEASDVLNATVWGLNTQCERRDLSRLALMTIDGQSTLDYDDALSLEQEGEHLVIGVHIADVAHYIRKGDPIDSEALARASSIYMPDLKIPMLPPRLAENLCSLKADELRPAISVLIRLNRGAEIVDYEIVPSLIRVAHQMTYYDANITVDQDSRIMALFDIATKFRNKRLACGAIQITLPEVNVWIDESGRPNINRINRESPSRLLVSELMILANWLMARFLVQRQIPTIFRSQPDAKQRLYRNNEGTLFQNWMQRKLLNRFVLGTVPESHSGLGLDVYTTATSPIRKYFDLITQRQLRSALGLESAYSQEQILDLIQNLTVPMGKVSRVQYRRNRYWLLKYLEGRTGQKEEAIVLAKRRTHYVILLTEYMIECNLPAPAGISLKSEDLVQVTLQHINARKDVLSVFLG